MACVVSSHSYHLCHPYHLLHSHLQVRGLCPRDASQHLGLQRLGNVSHGFRANSDASHAHPVVSSRRPWAPAPHILRTPYTPRTSALGSGPAHSRTPYALRIILATHRLGYQVGYRMMRCRTVVGEFPALVYGLVPGEGSCEYGLVPGERVSTYGLVPGE